MDTLLKFRRIIVVCIHLSLVVLSYYLAFLLQFGWSLPQNEWQMFLGTLPWLVLIRGLISIPFRLYEGLWRYTSIWDLKNIFYSTIIGSSIFYGAVLWLGKSGYPTSVIVIDSLILFVILGGVRLIRRISRDFGNPMQKRRILIWGAGDAGEMIARDMIRNPFYEYKPVGFIDDDPTKTGKRIHGLRVFGTRDSDLRAIMNHVLPDAILIAMPKVSPSIIRNMVHVLEPFHIPIQTLPNLSQIIDGKIAVNQIRNLAIEDLLERAPIGLEPLPLQHLIANKRVMVTGAGGSIGSELCRQIALLNPFNLVLFERYENGLYSIASELKEVKGLQPVVGDVTDEARVNAVVQEFKPDIIIHAAAHKHVPLMEMNISEAIKNNVAGTKIMVEAAVRHQVSRFVLISTDKAVNPTSVMGATKKVAELIIQSIPKGKTQCSAVRFGNVLGSNGSAVPLFLEQIKKGGPVTVTHPDMKRYFMLIPEAVQLVLHSIALSNQGEICVLEMGAQIKILDLVRNLIRLMGFVPGEDVAIKFVGLRPGEKLYEELVGVGEEREATAMNKIYRVKSSQIYDYTEVSKVINQLEQLAAIADGKGILAVLKQIIPEYQSDIDSINDDGVRRVGCCKSMTSLERDPNPL